MVPWVQKSRYIFYKVMVMERRTVLKILGLAGSAASLAQKVSAEDSRIDAEHKGESPFEHGIASGDPLSDRVILWTRIKPQYAATSDVSWQLSKQSDFKDIVDGGTVKAKADNDFTVKIDVGNLQASTHYYYRFKCEEHASIIGRTKTLARGRSSQARLAVVSCSNYPAGYFNVYREIANTPQLDAVVHLGDYIYEYGEHGYATANAEKLNRVPSPRHEIETLTDYRQRHAQYKTDHDLQSLHANHPMICIWDDHEFANNSWMHGNQHPSEKYSWDERKQAGLKAYYEWMPIRENRETGINRRFDFGDLFSLTLLDTRLKGREEQPGRKMYAVGLNRGRELLGEWQQNWLEQQLKATASQTWNFIGQQVMVSPLLMPDLRGIADPEGDSSFARDGNRERYKGIIDSSKYGQPLLLDAWDGYPEARERFLTALSKGSKNTIVLTGDIHTGVCSELHLEGDGQHVGSEFITPSVTSPGLDNYFPPLVPNAVSQAFKAKNKHINYINGEQKGWIDISINHQAVHAKWMTVSTVLSKEYRVACLYETKKNAIS